MKIDWKRKLTSRKFWMAVASFVSMLVIAFGGTQEASSQVTAIIIADNKRIDRVVTNATARGNCTKVLNYAQEFVDALEA